MKNLTNHLLVASPNIMQGIFSQSLIYICHHTPKGAWGLMINKPLKHSHLRQLLTDLKVIHTGQDLRHLTALQTQPLQGGMVNPEVGFVLHTGQPKWASSFAVTENVCVTTSLDVLHAIAHANILNHFALFLGCANWGQGQLEQEIANNDWFVCPMDLQILFADDFDKRYHHALTRLGIDLNRLSWETGHA